MGLARRFAAPAAVALVALTTGCASTGGDVAVVNTAQSPALVRDVDRPGREAFQTTGTVTNTLEVTLFHVPSDKRLVVEFVSGFCNSSQNVPVHTVRLSGSVDHFLSPTVSPTGPGSAFAVITQPTRIYVAPLAPLKVTVFPTAANPTTSCAISISGHLTAP
jgi:hypothetical protein